MKVEDTLLSEYGERMDQTQLWRIGMHLMPLYSQLSLLLIEASSFTRIISLSDKGSYQVNPALKEIRAVIKEIEAMYKSLGIANKVKIFNHKTGEPAIDGRGRKGAYEEMLERNRQRKIRLAKRA